MILFSFLSFNLVLAIGFHFSRDGNIFINYKKKKLLKIKLCKNGETTMREEGLLIG
jgi:hypothetical protein